MNTIRLMQTERVAISTGSYLPATGRLSQPVTEQHTDRICCFWK